MKKYKAYIFFLSFFWISVIVQAQYIAEVIEYMPAPGQYINTSWGDLEAAQSLVGTTTGHISLGSFGGYLIFRFENPVENHPDNPYGIDFSIFGNASSEWSEPGILWVMKDENGNTLPDDTWYELAGSDFWFSSTKHNYEATYYRPDDTLSDIKWKDNLGNAGIVPRNSFHNQDYYPDRIHFPQIDQDSLTFNGTRIEPALDFSDPVFEKSYIRSFGYADNRKKGSVPYTMPDNPYADENPISGGDPFDISWAVDDEGNYVELSSVDFVKVQSACLAYSNVLGEISTEILFAVDIPDSPGFVSSYTKQIVIKDLPPVIKGSQEVLEASVFHMGRILHDEEIEWSFSREDVQVNENTFSIQTGGELTITASLVSDPSVVASITTIVNPDLGQNNRYLRQIEVFPVPAQDFIRITDLECKAEFIVSDVSGKICLTGALEENMLNISTLKPGLYFLQLIQKEGYGMDEALFQMIKFIKK